MSAYMRNLLAQTCVRVTHQFSQSGERDDQVWQVVLEALRALNNQNHPAGGGLTFLRPRLALSSAVHPSRRCSRSGTRGYRL